MSMTRSRAALTVRVFSFYLFGLAGILILIPNQFLLIFGLPTTDEIWIRVVGVLVAVLGYYYFEASRREWTGFMQATVYGRLGVLFGFACFVVLGLAPLVLLVFGVVDGAAAVWTARGLSTDTRV